MNLDRGLIKQQARALIKDKVMKLFITSFVVSIAIMAIGGLSFSITSTSSNDIFNGSDYSFSDNGNSNDKNYFKDFDEIANFVSNNAEAGDLVITMGAGDIYKVADIMLERDWKKR